MNVKITVRGIDSKEGQESESIRNYIQDKFAKFELLLSKEQQPISVEMLATVVRPHPNHEFEIHLRTPRYSQIVKRHGPELYKVIDEVFDIAFENYVQHKNRIVETRRYEGYVHKVEDRLIKEDSLDQE